MRREHKHIPCLLVASDRLTQPSLLDGIDRAESTSREVDTATVARQFDIIRLFDRSMKTFAA